jgi:hypothetical protein
MRQDPDEVIAWQELTGKEQQVARIQAERLLLSRAQEVFAEDGLPLPLLRPSVSKDRRASQQPIEHWDRRDRYPRGRRSYERGY